LFLPEKVSIELAQVGSLALRPRCLELDAGDLVGLANSCESFSLDAVDGGVLFVEHSFARHVSNAMAGLPGSLTNRPLSRVERGMVAGLVAVSLAKSGLPLGVRVVAERSYLPMEDALCIHVRADLAGMDGHAWLCATATAWGRALHSLGLAQGLGPLRLELARTQLPRAEALSGRAQDLVVFDDSPACPQAAPLSVDICCLSKRLPARLERNGCVRSDDAVAATRRIRLPRKPIAQANFVEVTAELARPCPSAPTGSDGVILRIGEADWAEGLPATHEDRLAVRIVRILTKMPAG
jgi:hypothetical protein